MRQAVYDRARAALARQLTAVDPPLSADDLEAQHQQLEDAIAAIEEAVLRGEDPALAGIDWDAIDNEFANFEAEPTSESEPAPPPPPRRVAPQVRDSEIDDVRAEPRPGARFAQEPVAMEYDEDFDIPAQERPAKSSKAPFYIFLVLLLMIAGGVGAFAYTQWEMVTQLSETILAETISAKSDPDGTSSEPPRPFAGSEETATAEPEMVDDSAGKSEDRLIDGNSGGNVASAPAAVPSATDPAAPGASNLVGQKAIFYEQGSDGSPGQAQEGAVAWSRITRDDGSPAIEAQIDIPVQGLVATITISRNSDSALPASHLIEVSFDESGGLSPASIERVPALVMKPNEQARGQALTGAAVPVTESLFWIALSSDADAEQRNLLLMRDGAWFDMPILFKDGSRALITFEKGIPGDQVFETVMASWTPS